MRAGPRTWGRAVALHHQRAADAGHLSGAINANSLRLCANIGRVQTRVRTTTQTPSEAQVGLRSLFENIARSEQMHTDAVAAQLAMRSLADPVTDGTPGVFQAPAFQALYASPTLEGRMSDVAALRVGATVEDLDLRDIQEMRARTSDAAALALYDNLACRSRNHMRSFAGQLESRGERYVAAYLTPAELAAILASPREMCGG